MAISIPIISDFDGKGIKQAIARFKDLEGAGEKTKFALKKAMAPAAAAIGGLAIAAGGAVKAASDMQEAQSKVNVIFQDGADDIAKFAETAAKKIGQSRQAVYDAAGTFGTFGKAAGLSGDDLAGFSTKFTTLASDLASFNNTTPEDAIFAIGAAMRGESEPLRKYGVMLDDATLKAEAMKLGIYDGVGALTAQEKILAVQSAIFKQTGDAQGDFQRTSEGFANSQRTLNAQFDDMKVALGDALLPVLEVVLPKVKAFADWAAANPGTFKVIAGTIAAIAAAVVVMNIALALSNPFTAIAVGIGLLIAGIVIAYNKFEWFRKGIQGGIKLIVGYFEIVVNAWISVINAIIRGYNLIPGHKDIATLSHVSFSVFGDEKAASGGGGIPKMANGGIVTSPTLALIGEAGPEAVVPLNRAGGMGGVTINVNGGDPQAVVAALRRYMQLNGSVPIAVSG